MLFIPEADDHFAAVEKAVLKYFRHGIGLVPDKILEGIEFGVKGLMPFTDQVIAGKNKDISIRFYDALELRYKVERIDRLQIPFAEVVVDRASAGQRYISGGILRDIVGRIGQNEIHRTVRDGFDVLQAVAVRQNDIIQR